MSKARTFSDARNMERPTYSAGQPWEAGAHVADSGNLVFVDNQHAGAEHSARVVIPAACVRSLVKWLQETFIDETK